MKSIFRLIGDWLKTVFEEQKHSNQKSTILVLDGVRACAILFVITFHINWTNQNYTRLWDWHTNPLATSVAIAGGAGVTLFFVLSGFLLFLPYAKVLLFTGRWPLARIFYVRRAMRIMPGYYISLIVLILWMAPQYLHLAHIDNLGQSLNVLMDSSQTKKPPNLNSLGLFLTFLMDSSRQTFRELNGPYWTLAVEWQFYMILPLLALGILLLVKRVPSQRRLRAVSLCLFGLIAGGLCVRFFGLYFRDNPTITFLIPRTTLNVLSFFLFGITGKYTEDFAVGMLASLCYVYAQSLPPEHPFVQTLHRISFRLWGIGILLLVFAAMWNFQSQTTLAWPFLNPIMPYYNWLGEILLAFAYGMCIMAILFGPRELQRLFTWKPLRWIGMISYSLYIWHLPLILFFQAHIVSLFPPMNFYLLYTLYWVWLVVGIIPFCVLYYAFIERSGMRLGDHWRKAIETRHRTRIQAKNGPIPGNQRTGSSHSVNKGEAVRS